MPRLLFLLFFLCGTCFWCGAYARCKITPDSPDWPSEDEWQALNASISGRLIKPTPPGAVCHPELPQYNNASCNALIAKWSDSTYHLSEPVTVDYNDDACLPGPNAPCNSSGYPAYVIAAESATDIQAGVKFAARTGVRLIVKGTGHDYPGR